MLKKYLILLLTLVFAFVSCGEEGTSDEEFNTTDYVYLVVELTKTEDTVNRDNNLFKVNGKSSEETIKILDYINSQLTKQGHPITGITDDLPAEHFAFKIKAKDIKEVSDSFKITITAKEAGYLNFPFEYTGFTHTNYWCSENTDVQKEADFSSMKLAYMLMQYNYYDYDPEDRGFYPPSTVFDKLTGNPDVQNGMGCAGGKGVINR